MPIDVNTPISKVLCNNIEIPLKPPVTIQSGEYLVRVVDYDGTVLKEEWLNEGDVFEMPSQPSHSNLIFQEWSSPVDVINNTVTVEDQDIIIGPVYTTASGLSEFDITLTKVTGLDVTLNMTGTKNWGDGTIDTSTTHTYAQEGDYTITCDGTTMSTAYATQLFGQSSNADARNYSVVNIRLTNVSTITGFAISYCSSLSTITISNSITTINDSWANFNYSLKTIIFPNNITRTPSISESYGLQTVVIPKGVTTIGKINKVYSLKYISIPKSVTTLSNSTFQYCYGLVRVRLPENVQSLPNSAFQYCFTLQTAILPETLSSFGNSIFYQCFALNNIKLSDGIPSINQAFGECYTLKKIKIPSSVTSISSGAFRNCYSILEYDFSEHDTPPTLSTANDLSGINYACKILVKDQAALEAFQAATNWSTYADYMYIKE